MSTAEQADGLRRYYASSHNLRLREQTHTDFAVPRVDYARWTLDTLDWSGDESILDLGAGPGSHYALLLPAAPRLEYFGLDLSRNLLLAHPCPADRLAVGDAMQLPFADDRFDIVMANQMLYHLPDIDAGLSEIKRVLKPDGKLLAATDSWATLPELQVLIRRAIVLLSKNGAQANPPTLPSDPFALENGTRLLARHFYAVVRHDLPSQLIFDDIEPALEFLDSMRDLREHSLPADVDWDDLMLIMRQQMTQLAQLLGKLELSIARGALIASDSGGFIHDFVAREKRSGGLPGAE